MLNLSFSKKLLLFTLLTSFSPLTACGQKEASATSTSTSQSSTVQTTSSQQDQDKSQTSSSISEANQSVEAASEQEEPSAQPVTSISAIDLDAIASGDFSSIAGTWTNEVGKSITFTADGIISSENSSQTVTVEEIRRYENAAIVDVGFYQGDERRGGIGIVIYPAGVKTFHGEADERDHLQAGHSVQREEPQERYYKQ